MICTRGSLFFMHSMCQQRHNFENVLPSFYDAKPSVFYTIPRTDTAAECSVSLKEKPWCQRSNASTSAASISRLHASSLPSSSAPPTFVALCFEVGNSSA